MSWFHILPWHTLYTNGKRCNISWMTIFKKCNKTPKYSAINGARNIQTGVGKMIYYSIWKIIWKKSIYLIIILTTYATMQNKRIITISCTVARQPFCHTREAPCNIHYPQIMEPTKRWLNINTVKRNIRAPVVPIKYPLSRRQSINQTFSIIKRDTLA